MKIEYYYITDGRVENNVPCLIDLKKYHLITSDNLFYVSLKEFNQKVLTDYETSGDRIIYFVNERKNVFDDHVPEIIMNRICFACSHGIDEESYIMNGKRVEGMVDYVILQAISNISHDLIYQEYHLDRSKKTILVQDTTNTFFHLLDPKDRVMERYQTRLVNDLIELKKFYNIIIRYHPQYYQGHILGYESICESVRKSFIVSYTQMSLTDLYDVADIIISTRYTSSGYQAMFSENSKNKNIIMIDLDLTERNRALLHRCEFVQKVKNNDLVRMMDQGTIIGNRHVITGFENAMDIKDSVHDIERNNFIVDHQMVLARTQFVNDVYGISPGDLADKNDRYMFLMYVLAQTSVGKSMIQRLNDTVIEFIDTTKYIKFIKHLKQRVKNIPLS